MIGYVYIQSALDDHSRLVYSEVLADEQADTAVAFWSRAVAWFAAHGVTIERVLTDNGPCYRSRSWAAACAAHGIRHKRTPTGPRPTARSVKNPRVVLHRAGLAPAKV